MKIANRYLYENQIPIYPDKVFNRNRDRDVNENPKQAPFYSCVVMCT